jgi:hypothetical protein
MAGGNQRRDIDCRRMRIGWRPLKLAMMVRDIVIIMSQRLHAHSWGAVDTKWCVQY